MPSANISLRDRRRAELLSQIQRTAHRLFAERGFEAVTTEDIAAAAGVSISTYFRYAPTKEGLLVDPAREVAAEIVGAYSARPPHESAVEALIQLFVTHAREVGAAGQFDTWRHAVATAPHMLRKSVLISETDHGNLIQKVADRMNVNAALDIRPALLVHISLATVQFVLDEWLTSETAQSAPFDVLLEEALRITLVGFDGGSGARPGRG
ncbi:regulator [Mycobacterium colombiense]|uniref:Regulator n=2 Tax=Mycobacterium colombiense TaxID=339268 RepID=A0A853M5T8_9MYCO|nr:TetR family transcriptional regulator [Mycobacterium colombiense]OBJ39322.1 regulator [Mycobacterium colombiense]OBJ63736.1 regulator [Mycobacterium colombiense]OBK66047.1 regulator [Mycobacterium colombiense]